MSRYARFLEIAEEESNYILSNGDILDIIKGVLSEYRFRDRGGTLEYEDPESGLTHSILISSELTNAFRDGTAHIYLERLLRGIVDVTSEHLDANLKDYIIDFYREMEQRYNTPRQDIDPFETIARRYGEMLQQMYPTMDMDTMTIGVETEDYLVGGGRETRESPQRDPETSRDLERIASQYSAEPNI